jgi:Domain of unknown function (DUF4386)
VIKVSSRIADTSPRQAAVIAGIAYVIIIVLALFANFLVLARLTRPDDPATTVSNIAGSELLFRSGVAAFVLVFLMDAVVAWGLYILFQQTSNQLSLLAAWLRLLTAAISAAALLNLLLAVRFVDGTGYTTAFETGQRNAQVMTFLNSYIYGWTIGLVFFGFHLVVLGYLIVKSDYAPTILGVLIIIAGLGYVVAYLGRVLLPGYEDYKNVIQLLLAILALPAEFGLTGWLLWTGGKIRPVNAARAG